MKSVVKKVNTSATPGRSLVYYTSVKIIRAGCGLETSEGDKRRVGHNLHEPCHLRGRSGHHDNFSHTKEGADLCSGPHHRQRQKRRPFK